MDEEKLMKFVEAYLKKKGLKLTEHALQEEVQQSNTTTNITSSSPISSNSQLDPDVVRHILSLSSEYHLSLSLSRILYWVVRCDTFF